MPAHISLREFALGIFFVAILAFVHTWSYQDDRIAQAEAQGRLLEHYAALVAGCMNGGHILWDEPHSGEWMDTQCRTVKIGKPWQ